MMVIASRRGFPFRILTLIGMLGMLLVSCDRDGNPVGAEGAIVDNADNLNKLRQLLIVVRPLDTDGRSIVLDRIDTVKIKVDGKPWGVFTSDSLDNSDVPTIPNGDLRVTDVTLGYFVLANYTVDIEGLETAGDFAEYMNERLTLPPGDHVCEISELQFRDESGAPVVVKPNTYTPFRVEENIASVFLGEIDITIR